MHGKQIHLILEGVAFLNDAHHLLHYLSLKYTYNWKVSMFLSTPIWEYKGIPGGSDRRPILRHFQHPSMLVSRIMVALFLHPEVPQWIQLFRWWSCSFAV